MRITQIPARNRRTGIEKYGGRMYIPRRNRQAARKTTEPQMISIVIPSRNNEKRIGRTLAGIFAQNRRDFEVLSCDDNSADRTPAILDYYPEIRRFRMPEGEHLPGEILNRVLPECRGDIVVVNHADACPLDADYLNELLKPLGAPGTAAAFAQQESRPDAPFEVWCDTMRRFSSGTPEFSFAGAAVRRELFDRIPVGASLPLAVAPEWARRAEKAGARIVYAPAARIEYSRPVSWGNLWDWNRLLGRCRAIALGELFPFRSFLRRFLRDTLADLRAVRDGRCYSALPGIVPWRFVQHYAYYRGNRAAAGNEGKTSC